MRSFPIFIISLFMIILTGCAPADAPAPQNLPSAATPLPLATAVANVTAQPSPNHLWIDLGISAEFVNWVNSHACAQDISRVNHFSQVDLLNNVQRGQRLVVFRSVADLEQLLPQMHDQLDIVGYNLESGPENRPDEQNDPVGSAQRARTIADQYGKKLAFGPDHAIALASGVAMAPFIDIFVLQVQRVQTRPQTVLDFVLPLSQQLRAANPNIQIAVQIRTEGDVPQLLDLVQSMSDHLDGLSILTSSQTVPVADDLLSRLRPEGFDCSLVNVLGTQGNVPPSGGSAGIQSSLPSLPTSSTMPTQPTYRASLLSLMDRILAGGVPFILSVGGTIILLLLALLLLLRIVLKNRQHRRDVSMKG